MVGPESLKRMSFRYREAMEGEKNRLRKERTGKTRLWVNIEEPMAYVRLFGLDYGRFLSDAAYNIEKTLEYRLWRFENIDDAMTLGNGIGAALGYYPEYTFVGMGLSFDDMGVPIIQEDHPISRNSDLSLLQPLDFENSGWMPRLLRWYDEMKQAAGDEYEVGFQTWWRGSLDLAIQMRGYENVVVDSMENPEFLHALLDYFTRSRMEWYSAYSARFGCDITKAYIGDDWLNVPFITPEFFDEFVMPCYRKLEQFHGGIGGIHSCGNQTPLHKSMSTLKTLGSVEVSAWSDLAGTLEAVPEHYGIIASVHPNDVLFASPEDIRSRLERFSRLTKGRRFTLATSGLTPGEGESESSFLAEIKRFTDIFKEYFS